MIVRLPHPVDFVELRGVRYPVVNQQVDIPAEHFNELRQMYPMAEEVTGDPTNRGPTPPATDGRNKVR